MLPCELILFLFAVHEGFFAYTNGFMGRSIALLVSDVANCQLGGGSITYWYFKTGDESKLEVLSENHSHQMQEKRRSPPHRIGFYDWQHLRQSEHYHGQTMIIVSQPKTKTKTVDLQVKKNEDLPLEAVNTSVAFPKIINSPLTTTLPPKTKTSTAMVPTLVTTSSNTTPELLTTSIIPASTNDPLANITSLLRQTAPALFYIPVLIEILRSAELWNPGDIKAPFRQPNLLQNSHAFGVKEELRHTPVDFNDFRQKQGFTDLAIKNPIIPTRNILSTTIAPLQFTSPVDLSFLKARKNTYEIAMTTMKPEPTSREKYLSRNTHSRKKTIAINVKTGSQDMAIRALHRELFQRKEKYEINTTTPIKTRSHNKLVVFKRPSSTESEVAMKLTELVKYLPLESSDNFELLQQIPEIYNLTRGLDLTQVSKRGGISKLRNQFLKRLMHPTKGISFYNTSISQTTSTDPKIPFQIEHQRALNFAAPTAFRESFSEQSSPRVGVSFAPLCPMIDCSFDKSTMCNYVTSVTDPRINGTLKDWEISTKAVLNSLTGIPQDFSKSGSFIYAGGKNVSPHDVYILSSKLPVEIKEQARLNFFVYQAGVKGRLQVCINTINNCALNIKGSTIDIKARRWKNYHVPLAPDTHAIHFVVDGLHDNYAIGLDQIQLLNTYGTAAQQCK
ncbi:unnamed protein product [Angiostrongylus costaricensis]|uniref:MAM domain-containing protein n=1 Tax=Angiostrongylus costaricensis TaxID=334426 RepID=A0A0R3P9Y4_ANGCS|nr:unnamed protein product [Angiostrongylus costaricensis]